MSQKFDLEEYLKYKNPPTDLHKQIVEEFHGYMEDIEKWMEKSFDTRAVRARGHLQNIYHLIRLRRKEIQWERREAKNDNLGD